MDGNSEQDYNDESFEKDSKDGTVGMTANSDLARKLKEGSAQATIAAAVIDESNQELDYEQDGFEKDEEEE